MCIYASESCAEGFFGVFSLATKKVKSGSKYLFFFSNERHLKFDFQKKKTITFFRRNLPRQCEKDTIFHVTITFSPKQGENKNKHCSRDYSALKVL